MSKQKFYLTTPIYYVNARPHIGHAYSTIAADVVARRHRLLGDDTFFVTGTDEHGQKVERSAAAAGIPPQQFTDQVSASFRALWDRMGITYDDYIRTTDARHKQGVQRLWKHLEDRGAIYLSTYTGQYSIGEEMFVEGPPGTIGPDGKPTETVTEENYFFKLSEYQRPLIDLIESDGMLIQPESSKNEVLSFLRGNVAAHTAAAAKPASAPSGSEEAPAQTAAPWQGFFSGEAAFSGEASALLEHAAVIREAITEANIPASEIGRQAASPQPTLAYSNAGNPYLPGALKDLSISRTSFKWGIPVPGNEKHVIYVWLDALVNYMTAIGYGSDDPAEQEKFAKYWPADLHLVGKEITRFHCVYWPAFLLAAGLPTPKSVVANGWLLFEDSKMSKSKGNVVRTETILDAFGEHVYKKQFPDSTKQEQDLFASDVLRYFLLREIPFGQDGSFSFDALCGRYNSDLVNGYGNLVSRTLNLVVQHFSAGNIHGRPSGSARFMPLSADESEAERPFDPTLKALAGVTIADFSLAFERSEMTKALEGVGNLLSATDGFISSTAPWKLLRELSTALASGTSEGLTDEHSAATVKLERLLYTAAESIRIITALLYPVLPYATAKVWAQLGLDNIELAAKKGELKDLEWGSLKPGTKLGELAPIFPRAEKGLAQIMADMENPIAPPPPSKLVDEKTAPASAVPTDPTHPGAAPRTSAFAEQNPGATVGGSHAVNTERPETPSHHESPASGPFAASAAASATPDTPQIAIDDFVKIDLRVAQIVVAERIPKADKLLRLEVDLGYEKRQILSGIAEWYTPEELIGRKIVVIANLAPRKMRGLESHGMLLAASHGENGKPVLATFGEEIALGSRLR